MARKLNILELQLVEKLLQVFYFFIIELLFYDRGQWKSNFDAFLITEVDSFKACGYIAGLPFSFLFVTVQLLLFF